jgi:coenzyme Q-binding protein COQ10
MAAAWLHELGAQLMLSERVERSLPYSADQLFDIAADVERYPEFLCWWITARIRQRTTNVYYTEQLLGLGPLRVRFGSKTVLDRPERIEVTTDEPPFRLFRLAWAFAPEADPACKVTLAAEMEFRSRLLERVVEHVLPGAIAEIITAFETRARQLCENADRSVEHAG